MRRSPAFVLGFFALVNLARGGVHVFAPDGGAHSIAGLDLSHNAATILSLFAAIGLQQIAMGLFQIFVLAWRRDLIVIALALQTLETAFGVANLYLWRSFPVLVPAETLNPPLLALLLAALAVAWVRPARQ